MYFANVCAVCTCMVIKLLYKSPAQEDNIVSSFQIRYTRSISQAVKKYVYTPEVFGSHLSRHTDRSSAMQMYSLEGRDYVGLGDRDNIKVRPATRGNSSTGTITKHVDAGR